MELQLNILTIITVSAFDWDRLKITLDSMPKSQSDIEHILVCPIDDFKTKNIWEKHVEGINYENAIVFDENNGIYDAMNYGASFSSGKFLTFWNS